MSLLFATTWMDLESVMLSKIQRHKILYAFTYMGNLKNKTKQKQTHRYREQTNGC